MAAYNYLHTATALLFVALTPAHSLYTSYVYTTSRVTWPTPAAQTSVHCRASTLWRCSALPRQPRQALVMWSTHTWSANLPVRRAGGRATWTPWRLLSLDRAGTCRLAIRTFLLAAAEAWWLRGLKGLWVNGWPRSGNEDALPLAKTSHLAMQSMLLLRLGSCLKEGPGQGAMTLQHSQSTQASPTGWDAEA